MTNRLYEFGPFRLEETERMLLHEGRPVQLKPKVFDLLSLLVRNSGHILMKDELMKEIWPDSFVEEHNLAVSISALRRALQDDHRAPNYIETVIKQGYRFVARVRQIRNDETGSDPVAHRNHLPAEIPSIAVLPFKNIKTPAKDHYLGVGLADALITRLSNLKQIAVRPTSAVLKFAGKNPVLAGRQLKVDMILDGSIQKWGRQIRVTAQQVRVRDEVILWAAKFDEKYTNFFAIEDSISEQVANALSIRVTDQQEGKIKKRYTEIAAANQAYLKGRYLLNKRSPEDYSKSIKYFHLAIEIDPHYALAYVGLAECFNLLGSYTLLPAKEAVLKATAAALKALELDNTLAEAHTVLGHIKMFEWDWTGAEKELKLALELNQNCVSAHQIYSLYLRTVGRLEEAMRELKQAQKLDPLSLVLNASMGALLYLSRQYDEAIEQLKSTIEMEASFVPAHYFLGMSYIQKGFQDKAIAVYQKLSEMVPDSLESVACIGHALARSGRRAEAREVLVRLNETDQQRHVSPYMLALINAGLGDIDNAFACLEKAFAEHDEEVCMLKMDPKLDCLREDRRFSTLLRRIGLRP